MDRARQGQRADATDSYTCARCRTDLPSGDPICGSCTARLTIERLRQYPDERAVRRLGASFYFLAACYAVSAGAISMLGALPATTLAALAFCAVVAVANAWTGHAMARLKSGVRVPATGLALLAIPLIPLGTYLGIEILVVLLRRSGRHIFSEDYRRIMEVTEPPHDEKMSPMKLALVGLLATAIVIYLIIVL